MTNSVKKIMATAKENQSSRIFRQNRCLGYVSNGIPAVIRYVNSRKDTLITTCIGRSFQVYTASHFRLVHVSAIHPDEITALATDRVHTYSASNKCIYVWRSGKHIRHILRGHTKNVHLLLPFAIHLIAVDEANVLKIWNTRNGTVYSETPFNDKTFLISAIAHPPTYINKIVLGSDQGTLQLWNIKNNQLLFTFSHGKSRVTCIEPSPALDIVAVGHKDGSIILLNLKYDEIVMNFQQDWGYVSQISFRSGPPIMATASNNGYIAFWNLEEKKVSGQLQAHEGCITTMLSFPNEPLIFTTSPDNSMKLWIFDMPDDGPRLLRIRDGHKAPPLCIRYHGHTGNSIISSGEDSYMRVFSTISETFNKSMGKASYNSKASKRKSRFQYDKQKMPPIKEFTAETTREKEWDNIAAIHVGIVQTTSWSFHKNRMGSGHLVPEKYHNKNCNPNKTQATCVIMTHCGNFVVIGYASGDVVRFNIQSGLERENYGKSLNKTAHKAAVRGLSTDNLNQFVVSGCSEGLMKFWPFKYIEKKTISTIKFSDGISLMRTHRESAMIAVTLETFIIFIIDSDTKAVVRKFEGHKANINDLIFSPDSRWIISAGMDSTIKVWDIPSSYMVDHFKVERPCVSLTMSPTGNFLATAHVNCLGLYLWANKMLFNQISLRSINPFDEAPYVGLPASSADVIPLDEAIGNLEIDTDEGIDENEEGEEINWTYESPTQLSNELITMSGLATSRWQNLLDLDLIKKRNKPKAPPKAPKQAPFFLPTIAGLELKFDVSAEPTEDEKSRFTNPSNLNNLTIFGKMLENTSKNPAEYEKCVEHLKRLGPSMIDFEIKSLHPIGGGSILVSVQFLKTIEYMFETNLNFELAQSYLSAFLRVYGINLLENDEIMETLKIVSKSQEKSWKIISEKLIFGLGVVSSLRNFVRT